MAQDEIERFLIWVIIAGVAMMAVGFIEMGYRRMKDRQKSSVEKSPPAQPPDRPA